MTAPRRAHPYPLFRPAPSIPLGEVLVYDPSGLH